MIEINNLEFGYKRGQQIFDKLSLELHAGHIYGLLGRNGEGKSTLLKLISGMIFARSGKVISLGADPSKREPSFMSQIYYIPEEIYSPACSIGTYTKLMSRYYPNFSREQLNQYITEFELDPKAKIAAMSLGQKKKFAIAFGLACNTKLLIMDEPTNGLDIPSKGQFRATVARVATDDRIIIISTHQVRDLDSLIDNIVILEQGQIAVNCSVERISQRLDFRKIEQGEVPLYEQSNMMSSYGVVKNRSGKQSKVDMELLFNAAIANPVQISKILADHE